MIISTDIKIPLNDILKKINNYQRNIQSIALIHGSSSQLNKVFYVSDIDVEYWMRYQNNKQILFNNFNDMINLLLKNNMYFSDLIAGNDDRFHVDFKIRKDGSIINYDSKKIYNRINSLHKEKIIDEKDFKKLMEYVIDNPTLISAQNLESTINYYRQIHWTLDEIKKGEKIYYKKNFKLYDLFMTSVFLSNFVFEYSKGNYVLFDLAFRIFSLSDNFKNLIPPSNKMSVYDLLVNKADIYGEISRRTTSFYYNSIFKNYIIGHYLKILKRLKSLLGEIYFRPDIVNIVDNNLNKQMKKPKYRKLIKNVRDELTNIIKSNQIACLNQLKNRIDTIVILTKYKEELEIKRLIIEMLNDLKNTCGYYPDNVNKIYNILNNYDKDNMIFELKELKKIILNHVNNIALKYLHIYIDKLQFLLPFKIELPIKNK